MKILFIGGTGIISSACSQLAVERGMDLTLLNRGSSIRPAPPQARIFHADIRDPNTVIHLLEQERFDAVVDWVAFTPEHVQIDLDLFKGKTGQYVFISSASAYQTPPSKLPVTENTPLSNPYWEYSRNKIACEELLLKKHAEDGFPVTIVRPSHTYDKTLLPFHGRWTIIDRMLKGLPVIIHGDGTSIWTLTHHRDFAKGFLGLLGNSQAIGEAYHITSDEWLTWNQIYGLLADAAGGTLHPVHVPSQFINRFDPVWGASLLGDKAHSMIFDNSKIKRLVPEYKADIPFSQGAREIIDWHLADPSRQVIEHEFLAIYEKILTAYRASK
jgi:nucleoside-diphosphate-sugar epimerase